MPTRLMSRKNPADDVGFFNPGEADIETAEGVDELFVVDAEDVEHRGMEAAEVDQTFASQEAFV